MSVIPIPKPSGQIPVLGHLRLLDRDNPVQSINALAREMGEIFAMDFPGGQLVVVSGQRLVAELCDETRFDKKVSGALYNIRDVAHDGLFTAHTQEPNWQKAHNLLLPAFSMGAMANYYPMMLEIAEQLVGRWSALGDNALVDVPDDMVRLTLETIGLCGFDFRFGSFTRSEAHPFVTSMLVALEEALDRAIEVPLMTRLNVLRQRRYEGHVENLKSVVDQVIAERKRVGSKSTDRDLLSLMLSGTDPETGARLSDENIRYQIITFLIAGHETTSGLLSFAIYYLLKHPAVMAKAQAEVDAVLGADPQHAPSLAQLGQLGYLRQVLNEALRLYPPAPAFTLMPLEDTLLADRYALRARQPVMVLAGALHRDPSIWGDNPELFDPTHFSAEAEAARPAHAFKPFGNGQRACIGRQFALQEAVLALAMMLQRFVLIDHLNYQLKIKESLTFKAEGFKIRVRERTSADRTHAQVEDARASVGHNRETHRLPSVDSAHGTPLLVLFGSNMGSAEQVARRLLEEAQSQGYSARIAALDEQVGDLPTTGLVLIVTASYNGKPPDNAVEFVSWLETQNPSLAGVQYAVLGLGNRDWTTTYQRIPRLIDEGLAQAGAKSLAQRGEADAAGDFYGHIDSYVDELWPVLAQQLGLQANASAARGPRLEVQLLGDAQLLGQVASSNRLTPMTVQVNRELVNADRDSYGSKRHLTLALPDGQSYKTGDHLLVMPETPAEVIQQALEHFDLPADQAIILQANYGDPGELPLGQPVLVVDLLRHRLSLTEPATRRQLEYLSALASCPPDQTRLQALIDDTEAYEQQILTPRVSVLELLEQLPSCDLPLAVFLDWLPELHPRYYSISSSNLASPRTVDITVSVVDEPARSGLGRYQGAASSLIARTTAPGKLLARVRAVDSNFLPPSDPNQSYLMIGAGTGLAPFRGFIADRRVRAAAGEALADAWLIFGCRHPEADYLYRDELEAAEAQGLVHLLPAFSRWPESQHTYVQDRLRSEAERVWRLLEAGAILYVCGDARHMLVAVRQVLAEIYQEQRQASEADAAEWLTDLELRGQLRVDAWA